MTAPSPYERQLEAMLADYGRRLSVVEEAQRASQLDRSSIDNGVLEVRGADGTTLSTWGVQPDGTAGTKSFNDVPPPAPPAPTLNPLIAGIEVVWDGRLVLNMPSDFRAVNVHISPVKDFIWGPSNLVGSIFEAGSFVVSGLDYVPYYVRLVAVNQAGAMSQPSPQVSATPAKVVADAVLDGIIKETSLAEGAVTKAALAAGAVTQTAIAPGSIGTPQLIAGAVDAKSLAAGAVQAGTIAAGVITGREVKAKSFTGDELAANSINAGHVKTGAITSDKLEATLALASRLIAGDPTGTRVELSASGMLVIRKDGETTFQVDASTGDVVSMGQYYTQRYGERIAMNVAGLSEPAIRAYPRRGNRYADLRSYTRTVGSVDIANWEIRLPLQGQEAGLFDLMVYDSSFNPIASSRLRYRPFFNTSGVIHCGWAADGQDCAVVFYNGRVFITNSANNDRRPLNAGEIYAEDDLITAKTLRAPTVRTNGGNVLTDYNNGASGGAVYTRDVFCGDITYNNLIKRQPSHPSVKRNRRQHAGSPLAAVGSVSWDIWQYKPGLDVPRMTPEDAERDRVGPMIDEMLADPVLRVLVRNDEAGEPYSYDFEALVGVLGAALSEAHTEITNLKSRVSELEESK